MPAIAIMASCPLGILIFMTDWSSKSFFFFKVGSAALGIPDFKACNVMDYKWQYDFENHYTDAKLLFLKRAFNGFLGQHYCRAILDSTIQQ